MPDGIEGHIMQVTYYFLIKPRDTLLRRLQGLPYEWTELLGGPVLWTKTEGDRMLCSREDRYTFVKIVYLASIYNDYKDAPEYNDIFSDLKLDTSFFDMNWTLEEIEEVENVDDVRQTHAESRPRSFQQCDGRGVSLGGGNAHCRGSGRASFDCRHDRIRAAGSDQAFQCLFDRPAGTVRLDAADGTTVATGAIEAD